MASKQREEDDQYYKEIRQLLETAKELHDQATLMFSQVSSKVEARVKVLDDKRKIDEVI